jgi:hypothetical protein
MFAHSSVLSGGASLPTDLAGSILFLNSSNKFATNGALFNYTTNGLFVKGVSAQNVLTLVNNTNSVLLSVENSGILNVGTSNINLLQNTSIESDLLYFDIANDRIGIGTSTPQATLSIRSRGTNSTRGLLIEHVDNTTAFSHAKIIGSRSRGSHGSPSAVLANDSLVSFNARGYKATGWSDTVGGMYVYASENWTNTNTPTYITFRGVSSSSVTPTEWARLNSTGLGIGINPTSTLHVKGSGTTTGSSLLVQNSANATNLEVLNSSQSSVRIGVNNITTEIRGGSSSATDYILRVLRSGNGLSIRQQNGVPPLTTIEATNNLEIVSLDNSYIAIGNQLLLRSEVLVADQTYSALATGYGFALGSGRSGIRFGDSLSGGVGKVPYLMQVVGNNRSEAGDLKINPFGGNVGIGLTNSYLVVPTATLHVKGNSDSVGNVLVAENLSNTASLTIGNNGVTTFSFGSGGKVFINAPVGAGDTLLEIRRSTSSSGGFIFRSNNSSSQSLTTTNGSFNIGTVDNSNITLNPGTGSIFLSSTLKSYNSINSTGAQIKFGQDFSSTTARWINYGYHNFGNQHIIQGVKNGTTPEGDRISLNPYGGGVNIYADTTDSNIIIGGGTGLRIYRSTTAGGVFITQSTGGAGSFNIKHADTTNAGGNASIVIEQGATAIFAVGRQDGGTTARNHFYGIGYGSITSYNTLIASSFSVVGSERGITFSNSNNTAVPAIIQGVHSGVGRTLSLQYYGSNVGIGAIQPTAKLHVKGESDSVETIFRAENLSNTSYLNFANTGVLTTNQPSGGSNYTTLDFLRGGSKWLSLGSSAGKGQGLFFGNEVASVTLNQTCLNFRASTSNNTNSEPAFDFINENTINPSNIANYRFRSQGILAYSFGGSAVTVNVFQISNNFSLSTGNSSQFIRTLVVSPTINQTANAVNLIGIDYDPTITSITGTHYGILVRPNTLNGFGLTTNLPTAVMDLADSTTARASLRIRNGVAPTSPNDGDIWTETNDIKIRLNGVTYTLVKV